MADRAAKRMRRISTEYDESEGDGWDARGNSTRYVADKASE
jgi:Ino eighty subunit 2